MTLTLLLDLDDTLLDTNLNTFMPAYFQALANHLEAVVPGDDMLHALCGGMSRMAENDDPRYTLKEVFDSYFYPKVGVSANELFASIEYFYDTVFPTLEMKTRRLPEAVEFIEWAETRGFQIAIATDPLFPIKATWHRLRWAGFDPDRFHLVSAFEDFHFSKANPAYYAEVLGRLGWQDGPVLMVGNDPRRDILSAHRLGLKTFFIEGGSTSSPGVEVGSGQLADVRPWLESIDLPALEPSFKSQDAVLGILSSTPAVINHFLEALPEEELNHEPSRDDWAVIEIACHLRDTEREIHAMQLDLLIEKNDAFIPRPDTGVWASERDYLTEQARVASTEFLTSRLDFLKKLRNAPEEIWMRTARHAIFGPTNFLEVLSFMADHDRLHLQQAWKTMKVLMGERV